MLGFADQRLRNPDAPLDPSNRRISLIVQYLEMKSDTPAAGSENGEASGKAVPEAGAKEEGNAKPSAAQPASAAPPHTSEKKQ
jgi:chemotaxis protein MotB